MNKKILLLTLSLASTCIYAQSEVEVRKTLQKVKTESQAERLKMKESSWQILIPSMSNADTSRNVELTNAELGEILDLPHPNYKGRYLVKPLERSKGLVFSSQYIYLDGTQLSMKEIDSIRSEILARRDEDFLSLVKEYNMDGNPTGRLDWVAKKALVKEYELAVLSHKKGDIFTVDVPSNKWYYVVLKTRDDSEATFTKSLWIKYEP